MVFDGIAPDTGLATLSSALTAVLGRRDELHLKYPWSCAELCLDEQDYRWLRDWALDLKPTVLEEAERIDHDRYGNPPLIVCGDLYLWQVAIGLLLLCLGTEVARREALSGEIWRVVQSVFNRSRVKQLLFQGGNASQCLRDLVRIGATDTTIGLRHDFDTADEQAWLQTFWLQFGFSYCAFYGPAADGSETELPAWLSRQNGGTSLRSIDVLLNDPQLHSPSFYRLWRAMAEFRRGDRDDQSLRDELASNVWVLPQWVDDIARCLTKRRSLMALIPSPVFSGPGDSPLLQPRLTWTSRGPEFEFPLASLCELPSAELILSLSLKASHTDRVERCVSLARQPSGQYAPAITAPVKMPADCEAAEAEICDPSGAAVWTAHYELWDPAEDVNVFHDATGRRLSGSESRYINPSQAYTLIVADDLQVSDPSLRWRSLSDAGAVAYFLSVGWPSDLVVRDRETAETVWSPVLGVPSTPRKALAQVWLDGDQQHFGEEIPIRLVCQAGARLEAATCGPLALKRSVCVDSSYRLAGAFLSPEEPRRRLSLSCVFHINDAVERQGFRLKLNPVGMLMRQDARVWLCSPHQELDVYLARHNQFRVFVPEREDHEFEGGWTLWEGETPHGAAAERWRELPRFDGLGASFTARSGRESTEQVLLSRSVVDHGIIESAQISHSEDGKRLLTLRLHQAVISSRQLELRWWDKWWSMQSWRPETLPEANLWNIPLPSSCHGNPLALAVAETGVRLGAVWEDNWHTSRSLMQTHRMVETARNIRWLRLPVLSPPARSAVRQFVRAAGVELRYMWIEDHGCEDWQYDIHQVEPWVRAALTFLEAEGD